MAYISFKAFAFVKYDSTAMVVKSSPDFLIKNKTDLVSFYKKKMLFTFREKGKEGERKRGREISMCERNIDWLPLIHTPTKDWPTTQECALTGNQTTLRGDTQPTEPHGQR